METPRVDVTRQAHGVMGADRDAEAAPLADLLVNDERDTRPGLRHNFSIRRSA
jgi:hypothetical protein